jgi:hypothetical protein
METGKNFNFPKQDLRIGEFLLAARLVHPEQLVDAIETSQARRLPVGKVLLMSGVVTESDFKSAIRAQSMVRDCILPFHIAVKGLSLASQEKIDLEQALAYLGWVDTGHIPTNKLGELLQKSEMISADSLEIGIRACQAAGLPLGRVLVSLGMLCEETLASALNAQMLIREGLISKEQAIEGLKAARQRRLFLETMLRKQGFIRSAVPRTIRLGQLLVEAGVIKDEQLWQALTNVLKERKAFGQILCEADALDQSTLTEALKLQEMVANQTLAPAQAVFALKAVAFEDMPLATALAYMEVPESNRKTTVRFHDLLIVAGLIKSQSIDLFKLETDAKPGSANAFQTAEVLRSNTVLSEQVLTGALRCYFLIAIGWLTVEQGVLALHYFKRREISFDSVLQELKWTFRTFILDTDVVE